MKCIPIFIAIFGAFANLYAESVEWYLGKTVDCPVAVSMPTKPLPRTIIVPGGTITDVPTYWSENQLHVQIIRNSLILHLRDPAFEGTLSIYDDKGNMYTIRVKAAPNNQEPEQLLILKPSANPPGVAGGPGSELKDSDVAITTMMLHMVGGPQHPQIQGSIVSSVKDGKLSPGMVVFSDDMMSIEVFKAYQGPTVRGCECVVRYFGDKPVRLNTETLWFPGALAVYATDQTLFVPGRSGVELQPKSVLSLFYVHER